MANSLESYNSPTAKTTGAPSTGWFKLGIFAVASVLAGGMAAAWWYRNTLIRLRQAEQEPANTHFGISEDDPADEA